MAMRTPDRMALQLSDDTVYDADISLASDKGYWEHEARHLSPATPDVWGSDIELMIQAACPQFHAVSLLEESEDAAPEFRVGVRWGAVAKRASFDSLQARAAPPVRGKCGPAPGMDDI